MHGAASGSGVNLEVALALLRPSVFPELVEGHGAGWCSVSTDRTDGVVVVRSSGMSYLRYMPYVRTCRTPPGLTAAGEEGVTWLVRGSTRRCDI